jgi:hypothetical protein
MPQALKNFLLVVAFILAAPQLRAETSPFLPGGARTLHLSGSITNKQVIISWPVISGHWELMIQQPADTGEWQPIPADLYHTNAATVSVTQKIPAHPALYRLRRVLPNRANIAMPPMPKMPTNRIVPPKPQ